MNRLRTLLTLSTLIITATLVAACGGTGPAPGEEEPTPLPPDAVTLQMSWVHEYSFSELYMAQEDGHFADQRLAVDVREGGFQNGEYVEPIESVLSGDAQFGTISGSALLLARAEGKPVVAIASGMQRSPFALISLADSGIQRPQDLVGHSVAVSSGGAAETFNTLLTSQGIDPAAIEVIPRTEFGIDPLINGDVDVLAGWIINEAVAVQEAGYEENVILVADYGIEMYDKLYFTTEELIAENPDLVERMVRAIVLGMQDVVADPEQAITYTVQYGSDLDYDAQLRRLQASIPLINPAGGRVMDMDPEIWQLTYDIMREQGSLSSPLDVEAAYATEFLDKVYAE